MKNKIIIGGLYFLLFLTICIAGIYFLLLFEFDDIVEYYYNGFLKYIFGAGIILCILLPSIKYRKSGKMWFLPLSLILSILIGTVFCTGVLKFVEDDLEVFSTEKWNRHPNLRIYMLEDLDERYLGAGTTEERVKELLGESDTEVIEGVKCFKYYVSPGYMDPILFYVKFENGIVATTGKYQT